MTTPAIDAGANSMNSGSVLRRALGRRKELFDPIAVRDELERLGKLGGFGDVPTSMPVGVLRYFTEKDPRMYALWQISLFLQFSSGALKTLSDNDLLYLAGQSPDGYPQDLANRINFNKNKVAQNALRARVELETRAIRVSWRRTVGLGLVTIVLTAIATAVATAWVAPDSLPGNIVNVPTQPSSSSWNDLGPSD